MTPKKERRTQTRYPIVLPVKLTLAEKGKTIEEPITTENVSSKGALIKTDQNLPLGTDVDLTLELPLDQLKQLDAEFINLNITGQVIRQEKKGMVIEFDNHCQISRPGELSPSDNNAKPSLPFTPRENQILELICAGYSNKEIAAACDIGLSTVKAHIYNLYRKMGVSNRFQAILWWSARSAK